MKHIYFVRHGEPDFPEGKHCCIGITDLPLSDSGWTQARNTASYFADMSMPVYSSPLIRAKQTASCFGSQVVVLQGLQERNMGEWDGLSFDVIRLKYPELYARRGEDPSVLPPGAEEDLPAKRRFLEAVHTILCQPEQTAIAVTHSGVLSLVLGIGKLPYGGVVKTSWEKDEDGCFALYK